MKTDHEKLLNLMAQASHALAFRMHSVAWNVLTPRLGQGTCTRCHRTVQCYTNPPPNGIDIGGDALAVNCEDPKIKITVEGGVADYEVVSGDVDIEFIDYDNVENGGCPHGCGDLVDEFVQITTPYLGQLAGEVSIDLGELHCPHCGWKEGE